MVADEGRVRGVPRGTGKPPKVRAVLPCVGPGDRCADVVHADPELYRTGHPGEPDVAAKPVAERIPGLRILGEGPAIRRDRVRATENRVARDEPAIAVGPRVSDAEIVMERAPDVERTRAVTHDLAGVAHRGCEAAFHDTVAEHAVAGVRP